MNSPSSSSTCAAWRPACPRRRCGGGSSSPWRRRCFTAASSGVAPPAADVPLAIRLGGWLAWWVEMLTVQLFVRLFVLVGDAPCHDYHHRRPASKRWASYAQARQQDRLNGCWGFPVNYCDSWGLFRTIDANLATLAAVPRRT